MSCPCPACPAACPVYLKTFNYLLTKVGVACIMKIEKGKTSNGYAKTLRLFRKITLMLCKGWRYFFMVMINTISVIIYIIMYTYSISYHLLYKR